MAKKKKDEQAVAVPESVADGPRALRLADHPRATGQIRTVRSLVALVAFAGVLLLSTRGGVTLESGLTRALEAGVIGYLVAWAAMVMVWRQLAEAEIEAARRKIVAALLEMEAADRGGRPAA